MSVVPKGFLEHCLKNLWSSPTSALQRRLPRLREVMSLAQGHTIGLWQIWDLSLLTEPKLSPLFSLPHNLHGAKTPDPT